MNKQIIITGATGLIGENICRELSGRGDIITIFSRDIDKAAKQIPYAASYVKWNYREPHEWGINLNSKDAVIHLAGANLYSKRWTENYKQKIIESREISTRNIVNAIGKAEVKPKVFISASAVGYYGNAGDNILTEDSSAGNSFTAEVCRRWEAAVSEVEKFGVRRVSIRTAVVLNEGEGALQKMMLPFKFFLGGTLGNGRQWFPWIHIKDLIDIYLFALDNENISGALNAASPNPVRLKELTDEIGNILNRPSFLKVPRFALKIALGEFADEILASMKVIPEKLEQFGFQFNYGKIKTALKDLMRE